MVAMMRQAGEVLGLEEGGRRSLLFTNPAIPTKGTTLSLRVGLQMLRPREVAWAHRHSMGALRFVARGTPRLTPSTTAKSSIWRRTISF